MDKDDKQQTPSFHARDTHAQTGCKLTFDILTLYFCIAS